MRRAAVGLLLALPAACATPPAAPTSGANPIVGTWATAESHRITFRPDTLMPNLAGDPGAAYDNAHCNGKFQFGYGNMSRAEVEALVPGQPDVRGALAQQLVGTEYPVARLRCDDGYNTYVLLGDRDLLAIYRDGEVARIERLTRS